MIRKRQAETLTAADENATEIIAYIKSNEAAKDISIEDILDMYNQANQNWKKEFTFSRETIIKITLTIEKDPFNKKSHTAADQTLKEFLNTDHQYEVATRVIAYINGDVAWEKYWSDRNMQVGRPPARYKGEYKYFFKEHAVWIAPILIDNAKKEQESKERIEAAAKQREEKQTKKQIEYESLTPLEQARSWTFQSNSGGGWWLNKVTGKMEETEPAIRIQFRGQFAEEQRRSAAAEGRKHEGYDQGYDQL